MMGRQCLPWVGLGKRRRSKQSTGCHGESPLMMIIDGCLLIALDSTEESSDFATKLSTGMNYLQFALQFVMFENIFFGMMIILLCVDGTWHQ